MNKKLQSDYITLRSNRIKMRRLNQRLNHSFSRRLSIEKNRDTIRSYKESIVARNEEGRNLASQEMRREKESQLISDINIDKVEEPKYSHRPLPSTEQRPSPSPPNRFVKPSDIGRL